MHIDLNIDISLSFYLHLSFITSYLSCKWDFHVFSCGITHVLHCSALYVGYIVLVHVITKLIRTLFEVRGLRKITIKAFLYLVNIKSSGLKISSLFLFRFQCSTNW